ncbi:hypothetical protein PYCCODRAFT_980399 [Trametes coccinea BRFM310]|uniref:Uncharacterized protein n=1 Tax=Trametes coccinea (strain BRFM310) TaxID=1353009 RepID=A0A1Y2IBY2_TRAC3|nr:hypothetical protein PYCCODRAFT_980399 [Trametes coccinea BRFM310]
MRGSSYLPSHFRSTASLETKIPAGFNLKASLGRACGPSRALPNNWRLARADAGSSATSEHHTILMRCFRAPCGRAFARPMVEVPCAFTTRRLERSRAGQRRGFWATGFAQLEDVSDVISGQVPEAQSIAQATWRERHRWLVDGCSYHTRQNFTAGTRCARSPWWRTPPHRSAVRAFSSFCAKLSKFVGKRSASARRPGRQMCFRRRIAVYGASARRSFLETFRSAAGT